jgi:hypothetical protein
MNPGAGSGFKARYDLSLTFNCGWRVSEFADHHATKGKIMKQTTIGFNGSKRILP